MTARGPVSKAPVIDPEAGVEKNTGPDGPHIRCPLCGWVPGKHDRWQCTCGHVWNTFDTGGVCPACIKQWTSTKCPSCKRWSAHSAWYSH